MTSFDSKGRPIVLYNIMDDFGTIRYVHPLGVPACLSDYFFDPHPACLPDDTNKSYPAFVVDQPAPDGGAG